MVLNKEKLLLAMARSCMTNNDVAKKSGISSGGFYRIKNGRTRPAPATIGKIAKALGCDVTDLIEME